MTKLNQIIAVEPSIKSRAEKAYGEAYKTLDKKELFKGISRVYQAFEDGPEHELPAESSLLQKTVPAIVEQVITELKESFDITATKEWSNTLAKADIVVGGVTILSGVPITYLLFLEKKLIDLHTFVAKLPVLDPAVKWSFDSTINAHRSEESKTTRTKKTQRPLTLYEATKEHPAQVQLITDDEVAGIWTKVDFSGAITLALKDSITDKVEELQKAVKYAREEANSMEIENKKIGLDILTYVFKELM